MALSRSGCVAFTRLASVGRQSRPAKLLRRCTAATMCSNVLPLEAQRVLNSLALKPGGHEMSRSICGAARAVAGLPSPAAASDTRRALDSLKLGAGAKRVISSLPYSSCGVRAELADDGGAPASTPFPTSTPSPTFNPGPATFNSGFNSGPGSNPTFNSGAASSSSSGLGPGPGFSPNSGGPVSEGAIDTEPLWRSYFANPPGWWDDRAKKRSPSQPDFVRKGTRESLWIDSPATPSWVAAELAKMPPPSVAPPRAPGYRPNQGGYGPPYRDSNSYVPPRSAGSTAPPIDVTPTASNSSTQNGGDPSKPKKPLDPATQAHLDELRAPVDMERLKATMGKPISEWANYGKPESEHVHIPPPKPKEEVKARPKKPMSPETKAHLEALRAPVDMERLKATIGKPIEAWINYGKPESEWVHPPPRPPKVEKPKKPMSPETKAHLEALRAPVDMERLKATIGKPIEAWINYGKPESEWVHPPPRPPKVDKPKKPMSPETKAHLEALRGPVDMERLRATIGKPIEAWINYGKPESEWWHPPPPKDKDSMPPPRRRSVRSRSRPSS